MWFRAGETAGTRGTRFGAPCAALLLALAVPAGAIQGQQSYEDGAPHGIPEGFEPVDVGQEVAEIEMRNRRQIQQDAAVDMDYRYASPERRIRARYGGATWNLYDPLH